MASKREFWFQHVEAWRKGRMAQSEYARKHNLSIKSFGYYRRRYFQEKEQIASPAKNASLLPVTLIPDAITEARPTVPDVITPGISLVSPGGFRIELAVNFDPQSLQKVLRMLEVT